MIRGDLHEAEVGDPLAITRVQLQECLVDTARCAQQGDHRLVMEQEMIVGEGVAQALDPSLDALRLGTIHGARIEDVDAVAADAGRGLHALAGAVEHLADIGGLFADLRTADTDGEGAGTAADFEHPRRVCGPDALGQSLGHRVIAARQYREAVVGKTRCFCAAIGDFVGKCRAQAISHRLEQLVNAVQPDALQGALVVVRFEQQEAVLALVAAGIDHRILQLLEEGLAVEQAGGLVAFAQFGKLALEFRIDLDRLVAEDDLLAGFALIFGSGELHDRREFAALAVHRGEFVTRRRRLALGEILEQRAKCVHVSGCDQVEQGHAFDIVEGLEAEHLQIGLVGADVHALVDVGDGFARGVDQHVAAALGFAHLCFQLALRAAGIEVLPFGLHVLQELLRPLAQRHCLCAHCLHVLENVIGDAVEYRQQGHILAAAHDHGRDLLERHLGGSVIGQHHVHRLLLGQGLRQFVQ